MQWAKQKQSGFTIVELLIVIVVIAILAAITIVAYNGIQNRAKASAAQAAVSQAAKKIALYAAEHNDQYPTQAELIDAGITDLSGLQYSGGGATFCITATSQNISYFQRNSTQPAAGACPGHGVNGGSVITNLVLNPSMETNINGWSPRYSATLTRSTTPAYNSGSLQVVTSGAVADEGVNLTVSTNSVSSGVVGDHTGSAYVRAPVGVALRIFVEEYTAANNYVGGAATAFTGTGNWQRVSAVRAVGTAGNKIAVNIRTNAAIVTTFHVDNVMVTTGNTLQTFANGDSEGWAWSGSAHSSTSTGPPL
jgi:prepilin-type N-terminal cleavage/methylation domain-containing protein